MKPKKPPHKDRQRDLFRVELCRIVDSSHGLIKLAKTARSLWQWMKRRAAIEPMIGHLKRENRMDRNRLSGAEGDRFNAILSAVGMNFHKLLRWVAAVLRKIFYWLLFSQRTATMVA